MKSVRIRSYSGQHFPSFGLNTERCSISVRIQFKCGEIRTRITPNTDTFYTVHGAFMKVSIKNPLRRYFLSFVLKTGSHFLKHFFVSLVESPFKMMKSTFYFILKALFVLKIFKFLSWLFGHVEETASLER